MTELFAHAQNRTPKTIPIPDGELILIENFYSTSDANVLLNGLMKNSDWQQETVQVYGKKHLTPRLSAWYADKGVQYQYSGLLHQPNSWSALLWAIKIDIEHELNLHFNSVLANLYRNGNDNVGWHADDEERLGKNPTIASLSFGATRRFDLRHKKSNNENVQLHLNHGDLLVMRGSLQHYWKHQIPKQKKITEPRINLTFRQTAVDS